MFATPSSSRLSRSCQVCSDIAPSKCARLLLDPQSSISSSESHPGYHRRNTRLLFPRSDFQTAAPRCFCPVRDSKPHFGFAIVERRKAQTWPRTTRAAAARERRACVARCVPPGSNVAGALLIRGCRAATPARVRASIQAATSGDAEHALL